MVFSVLTDRQSRQIKSYVLRQGRLTKGQARAIEIGWPTYGLSSSNGLLDLESIFSRRGETVFEIGFGMGESLAAQAKAAPEKNFIGVEVHKPGVGHLFLLAMEYELDNLRVFQEDSLDVLLGAIPDKSLSIVQIFFPDPWPKKRHEKRRLVDSEFLNLLFKKLEFEGLVHIATDWVPYAEAVEELFINRQDFVMAPAPKRPETKFERRGRRLGHEVRDLAFRLA